MTRQRPSRHRDKSAGSAFGRTPCAPSGRAAKGAPQPRSAVAIHPALNCRAVPPSNARTTRHGLPRPPGGLAMTDSVAPKAPRANAVRGTHATPRHDGTAASRRAPIRQLVHFLGVVLAMTEQWHRAAYPPFARELCPLRHRGGRYLPRHPKVDFILSSSRGLRSSPWRSTAEAAANKAPVLA